LTKDAWFFFLRKKRCMVLYDWSENTRYFFPTALGTTQHMTLTHTSNDFVVRFNGLIDECFSYTTVYKSTSTN
jgi:hypothetical protein